VLTSNEKGAIAELEIATAALKLGVAVYEPLSEHSRADLIFEIGDQLWRVQCKWASLTPQADAVVIRLQTSRHSPTKGYVITTHSEEEVDLFGVYCGELDRCFLMPIEAHLGIRQVQLRLVPARNNQRSCINLADDYEFEGAIAQLGERRHGMAEAVGSSPTSSTLEKPPQTVVPANVFRDGFGNWMDRVAAGQEVVVTRRGKPRIRLSPAG
jgi:prevent-host-death family protein